MTKTKPKYRLAHELCFEALKKYGASDIRGVMDRVPDLDYAEVQAALAQMARPYHKRHGHPYACPDGYQVPHIVRVGYGMYDVIDRGDKRDLAVVSYSQDGSWLPPLYYSEGHWTTDSYEASVLLVGRAKEVVRDHPGATTIPYEDFSAA